LKKGVRSSSVKANRINVKHMAVATNAAYHSAEKSVKAMDYAVGMGELENV
jgi:hypothetical protein